MNQMHKVSPTQVEKFLRDVDYPASKDDLIEAAQSHGADQNVIEALREMPTNRFDSPADVREGMRDTE